MGAESIKRRLEAFDLQAEADSLHLQISEGKGQRKIRAIKRLKVVNSFLQTGMSPASMVLDVVPVIPPELRPMRSEEHTSELQSLMRISYAVFCLKKKKPKTKQLDDQQPHYQQTILSGVSSTL